MRRMREWEGEKARKRSDINLSGRRDERQGQTRMTLVCVRVCHRAVYEKAICKKKYPCFSCLAASSVCQPVKINNAAEQEDVCVYNCECVFNCVCVCLCETRCECPCVYNLGLCVCVWLWNCNKCLYEPEYRQWAKATMNLAFPFSNMREGQTETEGDPLLLNLFPPFPLIFLSYTCILSFFVILLIRRRREKRRGGKTEKGEGG